MKIKVSEDTVLVNNIRNLLKENGGYCPCSVLKSEDTKCMCREFREQQTPGPCHCGLYEKI